MFVQSDGSTNGTVDVALQWQYPYLPPTSTDRAVRQVRCLTWCVVLFNNHMDTHFNGHFPGNPALVVSPSIFLFHLFWICALLQHHFTMSFLDVPSFLSVGKLFLIVYVCSRSVAWCIGQGNGLVIAMLQVQLPAVLLPGNDAVLVVNKQCNLVPTKCQQCCATRRSAACWKIMAAYCEVYDLSHLCGWLLVLVLVLSMGVLSHLWAGCQS